MKKYDHGTLITLKGQRSCFLPVEQGFNTIQIDIISGILRVNHCSYTPDGGTWLSPPDDGRPAHYNLKRNGKLKIRVDIRKSFNKLDKIQIVNPALFKKSVFTVYVSSEKQE